MTQRATLTDADAALCIAALEYGSKSLREGIEAGERMGMPVGEPIGLLAQQMDDLRTKLLALGEYQDGKKEAK